MFHKNKQYQENNTKTRFTNDLYWIYGKHSVIAALRNKDRFLDKLILTKEVFAFLQQIGINPDLVKTSYEIVKAEDIVRIARLSADSVHQGIALRTKPLSQISLQELLHPHYGSQEQKRLIVILDKVTDPHNIGAIMRTAAAFEVEAIITTEKGAPNESASILKAASGAFEIVPFIKVANLATTMKLLQKSGFWLVGLSCDEHNNILNVQSINYDKLVLVFGNEEKGMRQLTLSHCDKIVKILMSERINSLNVSNAVAIALYTAYKRGWRD